MEVSAKKKNCELIAHEQNCTTPEKIKYHCVMNELENAFIEVCAPEYRIHGTCLGLNKKINNMHKRYCKCYHLNQFVVILTHQSINVIYIIFPTCYLGYIINLSFSIKVNLYCTLLSNEAAL